MGIKKTQLKRADKQKEFAQHETKPWKINVEFDKIFRVNLQIISHLELVSNIRCLLKYLVFYILNFFWSQCDPLSLIDNISQVAVI